MILALCIVATCTSSLLAQTEPPPEKEKKDPLRERLALRAGWAATSSELKDQFGSGMNLSLHFLWRFKNPFSIDFQLGAFYMGATDGKYIAPDSTVFDEGSVRIIRFAASPMVELSLMDKTSLYLSAGGGLYILSLLLDDRLFQFEQTNDHLGVNLGAGVFRQLSDNWFLNANFQLHKFWTSNAEDDLFFILSNGDQDPLFYEIDVGVVLRLF